MSDISVEKYERFRIDHGTFSSLYYPQLDIMNVEFFDEDEEDEIEETVWTKEDGFTDCQFDRNVLEQDLLILRRVI